jgi:uncharacterized protein (TIGR02594 family)
MARAWAELGQREQPGDADNARIVAYYADVRHADVRHDDVAWCAAFVGACLERVGIGSTRSLLARSYLGWGDTLAEPRFGSIAVLSRGSDPAAGHVGFWLGETADQIVLLGGNQSDAVSVELFAKDRLLGLRWPPSEPAAVARESDDVFEVALAHVLVMEGGYSDDPYDPGGPTNKGVTLATFARHLGIELNGYTRDDLVARLKRIDDATVRAIYRGHYWQPSRSQDLPPPVAVMHFDAAVNHGVGAAARMLQQALAVAVDGEIGPITLAAARRIPALDSVARYGEIRRQRYRALPHFWRFGRGWLARVDRTIAAAARLAAHPADPQTPKGDVPMTIEQPREDQPEAKWWGSSVTIWGAIITAVTTVLPVVAPLFGIAITGELAHQLGEQVVAVGQALGGLIGTVMTIWGRSRASSRLEQREVRFHL